MHKYSVKKNDTIVKVTFCVIMTQKSLTLRKKGVIITLQNENKDISKLSCNGSKTFSSPPYNWIFYTKKPAGVITLAGFFVLYSEGFHHDCDGENVICNRCFDLTIHTFD